MAVELQRPLQASFALDLHDGVGVPHHLDQAHAVADGQAAVGQHPGREDAAETSRADAKWPEEAG